MPPSALKGKSKFETLKKLLVENRKTNQILPTTEKIKLCFFKKTFSCSFRL